MAKQQNGAKRKKLREAVKKLVEWHFEAQPALKRIIWFLDPKDKEIRLLEVNPNTWESSFVKAYRMMASKSIPFPACLADVTPGEWKEIKNGKRDLPSGWELEDAEEFPPPGTPKKVKRF